MGKRICKLVGWFSFLHLVIFMLSVLILFLALDQSGMQDLITSLEDHGFDREWMMPYFLTSYCLGFVGWSLLKGIYGWGIIEE